MNLLTVMQVKEAGLLILAGALAMGLLMLFFSIHYLQKKQRELKEAEQIIAAWIAGDMDARLNCEQEGELYRLFHEVNQLAAILNARVNSQKKEKEFLKDTIADISHQLKTPLAALNLYNGILQQETAFSPELLEFTKHSEQELDRIEMLVQSLLKITKLDSGTVTFQMEEEQVSELMNNLQNQFAARAGKEDKKLSFTGDDSLQLYCDRNWLTEALSNLIKNALDHTKQGQEIHVEWKQTASLVQIRVRDNGCGIHPEDLFYIFKRFYRSRFSKDTQGIGLGLPLAKAIIEAHGGTIEVDSELGVGTVFTINFIVPTKL